MDYDKIYKSLPEIGGKDYDKRLSELDDSIPFTVDELFTNIPHEIPINENENMKFSLEKIGNKWYIARFWVYKSPYHRDWERITMNYFAGPTVKIALYGAYCWTNKN